MSKFEIDFSQFASYAEKLDELGADLREITNHMMEDAGQQIAEDTTAAVARGNLPAKGKYSHGETAASIVQNPKVEWSGNVAEIHVGFDHTVPGAGGFLITGTPKMAPDKALQKIYKNNSQLNPSYVKKRQKDMQEYLMREIQARM